MKKYSSPHILKMIIVPQGQTVKEVTNVNVTNDKF